MKNYFVTKLVLSGCFCTDYSTKMEQPAKMDHSKAFKEIDKVLRVGGKIVKYDITPLTAFGENFGSIMLRVDFTIENSNNQRTIHTVAKLIPGDQFSLEIFNTQVTYKSEIKFYTEIVPTLQEFQREQGVSMIADYFPKIYGGRTSLNPYTDVVDSGAIMLLENLKEEGYVNEDRHVGFDLTASKLVLDHLANLQATVTALKIKKPEVFEDKIKKHFTKWKFGNLKDGPMFNSLPDGILKDLKENPKTAGLIPAIQELIKKVSEDKPVSEIWGSLVHNDFWVNNMMIKHDNNGAQLKLIDFQCFDYGSCVKDLIFFLCTSVQNSVLKYHFDKLLRYYYDQFIRNLKELKVDLKEFTFKSFENELAANAAELIHATFFLMVVLGPKYDKDAPRPPPPPPPPKDGEKFKMPPFKSSFVIKERLWTIWEEAARKKWI